MKRICTRQLAGRPLLWWLALILFMALIVLLAIAGFDGPYAKASSTVTIISPSNGDTVSSTVHIKVQCSDGAGIRDIVVTAGEKFDGGKAFDTPYPTTYTWEGNWDTTKENNGPTKVEAVCYNSASDMTTVQSWVTVNNVKGPSVSWQHPSADQQFLESVSSTPVQASIAKGEGSAINRVRLWCDSTLLQTWNYSPAVNSTTCSKTLGLSSFSLGKHTLRLIAENTDGGSTTSTRTIYRIKQPVALYLAEGSTDWGFSCYITVENPNSTTVDIKPTYQTSSGPVAGKKITMPAKSQSTINPRDILGNKDFSTKVECLEGKTISADRTMVWNSGPGEEGHCAIGVNSPAKTWYLPEGSSAWGFETWLLIQNPGTATANCTLTYMIEGAEPITVPVQVPAGSRGTWNMADHIGSHDASIKVTSDQPVIPERAMYRNNRREGHGSTGTTTPANDYFLAEGAVGYDVGYVTYVLVQNPNASPADVSLTYMTGSGQIAGPSFQMAANSRKTIRVNDQLPPGTDVSTKVHGSQPIIAERAMYWNNGTGEACHDSIGMSAAHQTFYLPDGQTDNSRETWTLVQNPNSESVTIEISYLTPNGEGNVTKTETIAGNSRRTFNMANHSGISGRASIMVTSKTSGKKIMVERAMYWNSRDAGTDTIGGFSD